MKKLTKKQADFIEFYKKHYNGSRAARQAGYSHRSAANIAYENMRKPHIRAPIDEHLEAQNKRYEMEWQKRLAACREAGLKRMLRMLK